MKLFARRVLVKHRHVYLAYRHSHEGNDEARDLTRRTRKRERKRERERRLRGIGSFFSPAGLRLRKKLRGNTRDVISEMETRSLACADIKETFLSRKNNMRRARCLLCACILSSVFNIYNVLLLSRYAKRVFLQDKITSFERCCWISRLDCSISIFSCRLIIEQRWVLFIYAFHTNIALFFCDIQ